MENAGNAMQNKINEINELLKEFPELQRFANRMSMIAGLVKDAEEETDLTFMTDSFKTVLRLQERLHAQMLAWHSEEHTKQFNCMKRNCREWKELAEKYKTAVEEERQANRESFDNLCGAFTVNPRLAFEMVLRFIERDEKCQCPDGYMNWQWNLHFPLTARLRMAWRLIFGRKDLPEGNKTA